MSLNNTDRRWLILRSAILPALFIVPFFTNHFHQFVCPNPGEFPGPCYVVSSGPLGGWLGLFTVLFAVGILFTAHASVQRGRGRIEFAKTQLRYALITLGLTAIAYALLYWFSEQRYLHLLNGYTPPRQEVVDQVERPLFGVSFPPSFLITFSILYLLNPVLQWRNLVKDKSRVAGIKKKELFQ